MAAFNALHWRNGASSAISAASLSRLEADLSDVLGYDTAAELRAAGVPSAVLTARTRGALALGDGGHGLWRWDAASTAADNLGTVLQPPHYSGPGRWVRVWSGPVEVPWFGGQTGAAAQAAIDAVEAGGAAGSVYFPWGDNGLYDLSATGPLYVRRASLIGDPRRPILANWTDSTGSDGKVLFPGNAHPYYTSLLTTFPCSIAAGSRVVTVADGDWAVGDQVVVRSVGEAMGSSGVAYPDYVWLAVVEAVDGADLRLSDAPDRTVPALIGRCASVVARDGVALFFYHGGTVRDLRIVSARKWVSDSAQLNTRWHGVEVDSEVGIYGNLFQGVQWRDSRCVFSTAGGEISHHSLRTTIRNCKLVGRAVAGRDPYAGLAVGERSREISVVGCEWDCGDVAVPNLWAMRTTERVVFQACRGRMPDAPSAQILYLSDSSLDSGWPGGGDNAILDCAIDAGACTRSLVMTSPHAGNRVERVTMAATPSAADSLLLTGGPKRVVDCQLPGRVKFAAAPAAPDILLRNELSLGFTNESTATDYRVHQLRGNRSADSALKLALGTYAAASAYVGPDAAGPLLIRAIGAALRVRDTLGWELWGYAGGTMGARTLRVYLDDGAAGITLATGAIAAADTGEWRLSGHLQVLSGGTGKVYSELTSKGGIASARGCAALGVSVISAVYALRVDCACVGANTSLTAWGRASVANPWYLP